MSINILQLSILWRPYIISFILCFMTWLTMIYKIDYWPNLITYIGNIGLVCGIFKQEGCWSWSLTLVFVHPIFHTGIKLVYLRYISPIVYWGYTDDRLALCLWYFIYMICYTVTLQWFKKSFAINIILCEHIIIRMSFSKPTIFFAFISGKLIFFCIISRMCTCDNAISSI